MPFDTKVIQVILALLTALCSVGAAYFTLQGDIRVHEEKIIRLENLLSAVQNTQGLTNEALYEIRRDMAVVRYQVEKEKK